MNTAMIIRIIVLVITLINQVLTATGKNPLPFSDDTIYETVSILVTIAVTLWTAWKNNSFSLAAKYGDKIMNAIKNGTITPEKVEEVLSIKEDVNNG